MIFAASLMSPCFNLKLSNLCNEQFLQTRKKFVIVLLGFIGLVTWRINTEHGTEVVVHSFGTAVNEHIPLVNTTDLNKME